MGERVRLVDVNVLVALTNPAHLRHEAAHRWIAALPREARWSTTPMTEAAFVRLMTNPVVAGREISAATAVDVLGQLRGLDDHVFLPDASSVAAPAIDVTTLVGTKQVTDFHLVNLAAANDAVLATFDARITDALAPPDRRHVEVIPG
ncbi:TA system VapC family ribonuclease toxin [Georgenia yuyongxinii]